MISDVDILSTGKKNFQTFMKPGHPQWGLLRYATL